MWLVFFVFGGELDELAEVLRPALPRPAHLDSEAHWDLDVFCEGEDKQEPRRAGLGAGWG